VLREVGGPANWKKRDLQESDWLLDVSSSNSSDTTTKRIEPIVNGLADRLENGPGVILLRGISVETSDEAEAKQQFLDLMSRVGTAVSQSAAGDLVFSVRDAGFKDTDTRARGPNTKKKLSFHTDRCDVIAFQCLQTAKSGGENQVVSSVAIYNEIRERRPDLLSVLMKPFLYKRHNVDTGNAKSFCEQPIFSFCEDQFACAFLRVLIDRAYADEQTPNIAPEQKEALDFLESVAAEPEMQLRFTQEPGDILLLNNWITLHRRTAFEDWPEPERRRHILRIWLSMPNSRPLDPMYKANYGAVGAGEIRGGMQPAT
jgi:alpha-ketoglutarate-dependent taurine dioxygenase